MSIHSTLHGYRIQFLYTLYRMVVSENSQETFTPEGREDLDIYENGVLTECVQVKCHKQRITYKDLYSSARNTSLYSRAMASQKENSTVKIKLLVVGGSISEEISNQSRLAKKLKEDRNLILNGYQAKQLAKAIETEIVDEEYLVASIKDKLKSRFIEINTELGIKILTEWIGEAAEKGERLTQADLEEEILAIRENQSRIQAFHSQLGTAIRPLFLEKDIDDFDEGSISDSFYEGVSAQPEHIIGGYDIVRNDAERDVELAFQKSNIVIVHGISGAGKSTFAYRYIYEHTNSLAFEIKDCNTENITEITASLLAIAKGLRIPALFYFDVNPSNQEWIKAISVLSGRELVRCIVTMRQEDWNVQKPRILSTFKVEDILLDLNEKEADLIYQRLTEKGYTLKLSFPEAWKQLGLSGNLLEFVYLLTHGESLESRIADQANNEPDDVKVILGYIATVNNFGGRLNLKNLVKVSNMESVMLSSSLTKIKQEYFRIEDGYFEDIHPVRTKFIVNALFGGEPILFKESAMKVFNHIDNVNGHIFLLRMMKECKMNATELILEFRDKELSPGQAYNVARALLWYGIHEYEKAHVNLLLELEKKVGPLWEYLLPMNFTEIDLQGSVASLTKLNPNFPDISDIESKFADQKEIFIFLKEWCQNKEFNFMPKTHHDWYYLSKFAVLVTQIIAARVRIVGNPLSNIIAKEKLEECAYILLGLKSIGYYNGVAEYEKKFIEKLRIDYNILSFERRGGELWMESFLVYDDKTPTESENPKGFLTEKINVKIIDLCRCAFPEMTKYHSEILKDDLIDVFPDIPTEKHISRANIPLEEMRESRTVLCNLFKREGKIKDRNTYAHIIFDKREDYVNAMYKVMRFLDEWHKSRNNAVKGYKQLMEEVQILIRREHISLPTSEVSEFGYQLADSSMDKELAEEKESNVFQHIDMYFSRLQNYCSQFGRALLKEGNFESTASSNLYEVMSQLSVLQNEYKKEFGKYINTVNLDNLESRERKVLTSLWVVWESLRDNFSYSNSSALIKRYEQMELSLANKLLESISIEWQSYGFNNCEINMSVGDNQIDIQYSYQDEVDNNNRFSCIQIAIAKKISNYRYFSSQRLILESKIFKIVVRPLYQCRDSRCVTLDRMQFSSTLTSIFGKASEVADRKDVFFFVPEIMDEHNIPVEVEAFNLLMSSLNTIIMVANKLNYLQQEASGIDEIAQNMIKKYAMTCKKIIQAIDISKISVLESARIEYANEKMLIIEAIHSIKIFLSISSSTPEHLIDAKGIEDMFKALTPLKMQIQMHLAN